MNWGYSNNKSSLVILLLLFFFIDELAFILYNISFFQFMCANAFSLFFTDEIPVYTIIYFSDLCNILSTNIENDTVGLYHSLYYLDFSFGSVLAEYTYTTDVVQPLGTSIFDLDGQQNNMYYKIKLEATNVKKNLMSFYPLQQYIYTIPGESSLIFYRLENKVDSYFHTLSVYVTTPSDAVAYIKKLQCFCYEELLIAPYSIIDLPILFSIDEEILNEEFKEITINYILLLK